MTITRTASQVTKALEKAGFKAELVRGEGYWYFDGPDAEGFEEQGVYGVYRIGELSVQQWVDAFKEKHDARRL